VHQERVAVFFWNFVRKLKRTSAQITRTGVSIAKIQEKTKNYPKPTVTRPKPKRVDGSGSPERLRGVGLIQIHQDLDPTV